MNQSSEPLAQRLRYAALDRTHLDGEPADDIVLDEDGVIDLRELERERGGVSIAAPAAALASIRGQLGEAAGVSELYDESEEPERRFWGFGKRVRHGSDTPATASSATPTSSNSTPTTARSTLPPQESDVSNATIDAAGPIGADTEPIKADRGEADVAPSTEAVIDLSEADRPTEDCPRCAGVGRRDLFDRVSGAEYFSCDQCSHMWQRNYS
jgi:hypothetical protein